MVIASQRLSLRPSRRSTTALLPALVVTDIDLPDVDGFTLCEQIRHDDRTAPIPVVALTGHTEPGYIDLAENAGVDAYLLKPFLPHELVVLTQQIIARSAKVLADAQRVALSGRATSAGRREISRVLIDDSRDLLRRAREGRPR